MDCTTYQGHDLAGLKTIATTSSDSTVEGSDALGLGRTSHQKRLLTPQTPPRDFLCRLLHQPNVHIPRDVCKRMVTLESHSKERDEFIMIFLWDWLQRRMTVDAITQKESIFFAKAIVRAEDERCLREALIKFGLSQIKTSLLLSSWGNSRCFDLVDLRDKEWLKEVAIKCFEKGPILPMKTQEKLMHPDIFPVFHSFFYFTVAIQIGAFELARHIAPHLRVDGIVQSLADRVQLTADIFEDIFHPVEGTIIIVFKECQIVLNESINLINLAGWGSIDILRTIIEEGIELQLNDSILHAIVRSGRMDLLQDDPKDKVWLGEEKLGSVGSYRSINGRHGRDTVHYEEDRSVRQSRGDQAGGVGL
ncbi:hypothetical protein PROFUN_08578 [Planoprotostelium fungivorum]|uniref:Uncharacterized protein n=1 Tax=Planoprotostelium fungivorum TaxID=1890364 RepID=A0A2P6N1Q6_9EUKA|nr:hypothetical protein PROFUN_08578 [Planoprotostelium fungivorum]